MTALARKPALSLVVAGVAGLILFAGYCKLHALAAGVRLPWTAPALWGLAAGVPAGCLAYALWRGRARTSGREHALLLGAFVLTAATFWGVLVRGIIGPGRIPEARALAAQLFAVLPMSAALAGAAALLTLWHLKLRRDAGTAWIHLPEEPLLRLRSERVSWVSAAGNYCEFHADGRVHLVRVPLARIADRLEGQGFTRVHRSALINVEALLRIERAGSGGRPVARLRCGTAVPIGRRFQAEAIAAVGGHSSRP